MEAEGPDSLTAGGAAAAGVGNSKHAAPAQTTCTGPDGAKTLERKDAQRCSEDLEKYSKGLLLFVEAVVCKSGSTAAAPEDHQQCW